jgi:hypothetical protein
MKIIQSFAKFEEGNPYMFGKEHNPRLNFYSFLLSYLTLKKYNGSVTMYCNSEAYSLFIKYIPYDDVVIMENSNKFDFWNKYKIDVMRQVDEDFIHVDSDVFIFDDKFREYINDDYYGLIVQDIIPEKKNFIRDFYYDNIEVYSNCLSLEKTIYDNKCASCGVIGMKLEMRNKYFDAVDRVHSAMTNNKLRNVNSQTMILEELTAYILALNLNIKIYDILPHDQILKYGLHKTADKAKYTHMWFDSKFDNNNIGLIKNKIRKDFPESYHIVEKYTKDIIRK